MSLFSETNEYRYELTDSGGGKVSLKLEGAIEGPSTIPLLKEVLPSIRSLGPSHLVVDLEGVTSLNDFGAMVLAEMKRMMDLLNGKLELVHASGEVKEILRVLKVEQLEDTPLYSRKYQENALVRLGEATLTLMAELKYLVSFAGSVFLSLLYIVRHPRSLRSNDTLLYMQTAGVDALPIVGLISLLLGLIMAFMSSFQLERFGANVYVASLVSLAMVRELGPIMTAIIVAGRSGSAFAAEIGTMKISEEIDALFTMGFDPTRFLVVPKIVASVITLPLLALFSDLFAICGGLIVGVLMLDLTFHSYIVQTMETLELFDVVWGLFKSGVFALLITWVSCFRGFQAQGSAASVGRATTSAVVSSIFLIILSDSVFAVILRYWG